MSQEDVRAIRGLYDAFGRKALPAIIAVLHPQVEFYQSALLPWGGIYRGQEEAKRFFTTLVEHIVAVGHSRGWVKASGQAFEVAVVHVWTMRQGKALRFENYIDTPTMLRATRRAFKHDVGLEHEARWVRSDRSWP